MAMVDPLSVAIAGDRSLLIVEDDKSFLQRLARAMESRGFAVTTAESVADGLSHLETALPAYAVVDMRLEDGNGLDVVSALKKRRPDARAIILTGYGNIATAVNAVKLGAVDYLSKPADADDVVAALLVLDGRKADPPENPMSADRVRWEHVRRSMSCARATSRRPRDGSTSSATSSVSWPSARRMAVVRTGTGARPTPADAQPIGYVRPVPAHGDRLRPTIADISFPLRVSTALTCGRSIRRSTSRASISSGISSVPAGTDCDRSIRQHLDERSMRDRPLVGDLSGLRNVVAKPPSPAGRQACPVLLDPLTAEQFPMGSCSTPRAACRPGRVRPRMSNGPGSRELRQGSRHTWLRRIVHQLEARLIAGGPSADPPTAATRAASPVVKEVQAQDADRDPFRRRREGITALKAHPRMAAKTPAPLDRATRDRQGEQTTTTSRADFPAGVHDRHIDIGNLPIGGRSNETIDGYNTAHPEHAGTAKPTAGFSLKSTGMLSIAAGLAALTLVLLPVGLSLTGTMLLLLPAAGLAGTAYYLRLERRALEAANEKQASQSAPDAA